MKTSLIAAALLVGTVAASPVAGGQGAWQVGNDAFHLYNGDLDMNTAAGRAALLSRIERLADRLCRDRVDRRGCVAATVADTSQLPEAAPLRVALAERSGVALAAR